MFYFYTIFIPISIILLCYFLGGKPNKKSDVVNYLFKTLITYALLLYYLEMENFIDSGWAFYSIIFFVIPFGILIAPFKLYYLLKRK